MMGRVWIIFLMLPLLILAQEGNQGVMRKQESFSKEKILTVSLTYGNGYISIDRLLNKNVFEGEFIYEKYRPNVDYEVINDEGKLDIFFSGIVKKRGKRGGVHHINSIKKIYDNELRLNLSNEVPIDLDLELGVVKGDLDLTGLKIRNLNMAVGVSKSAIIFDESNPISLENCSIEGGVGTLQIENLGFANVQDFHFEGGVGSYEIDFGGQYKQDISAKIELGMGKLSLYLPNYIGTRIKINKSFLASVSIDDCYKKSDYYYNNNWEKTSHKLEIEVETGIGKLEVFWLEE
jgi:hypothetical protein